MEKHATYEDANLILRLYDLRREARLREARDWFGKNFHAGTLDEFNTLCPPGSDANAYVRMVVGYWETAASLVACGVLNEDLFFRSNGELLFVWERIRGIVPALRDLMKDPTMFHNVESVANSFIQWINSRSPEAYAALTARAGHR